MNPMKTTLILASLALSTSIFAQEADSTGLGEVALPWLVEAGKLNGLPVTKEVTNHAHVESLIKTGVDVLQIGARTAVNPFAVQEIADVLAGTNIPVMIKIRSTRIWCCGWERFERFEKVGITDLTAFQRGF